MKTFSSYFNQQRLDQFKNKKLLASNIFDKEDYSIFDILNNKKVVVNGAHQYYSSGMGVKIVNFFTGTIKSTYVISKDSSSKKIVLGFKIIVDSISSRKNEILFSDTLNEYLKVGEEIGTPVLAHAQRTMITQWLLQTVDNYESVIYNAGEYMPVPIYFPMQITSPFSADEKEVLTQIIDFL
jgi:hypothetical protein